MRLAEQRFLVGDSSQPANWVRGSLFKGPGTLGTVYGLEGRAELMDLSGWNEALQAPPHRGGPKRTEALPTRLKLKTFL